MSDDVPMLGSMGRFAKVYDVGEGGGLQKKPISDNVICGWPLPH